MNQDQLFIRHKICFIYSKKTRQVTKISLYSRPVIYWRKNVEKHIYWMYGVFLKLIKRVYLKWNNAYSKHCCNGLLIDIHLRR